MTSESSNRNKYSPAEIVIGILFWGMIGALIIGYLSEQVSNKDNSRGNGGIDSPYSGYDDGNDQDCSDVRRKVFVGSDDPDRLDADGDGWGCESYGG